ncbi:hypothetical protein [Streptomyces bacillaris]|uniref:hypothetical protein n=1 Tax=Streptomyces bacillaris TaxID=68179 RepID=UPI003D75B5D3
MTALAAVLAALAAGYGLGRWRPGRRLLSWAEYSAGQGRHRPAWWMAQVVGLVALACIWTIHPRRSLANVRAWRAETTRTPAPAYDPQWAQRRTTRTRAPEEPTR